MCVLENEVKQLQDEVGRHGLVLTGLYALPHGLHPVLPLDVGVEGRQVNGGEDGTLWEGPDVLEKPKQVRLSSM